MQGHRQPESCKMIMVQLKEEERGVLGSVHWSLPPCLLFLYRWSANETCNALIWCGFYSVAFTITWSHPSWPSMAHLHCLRWLNIFFGRTVFTLPVKFQRTGWSQSFWLLTPLGVQTCCITVALQHSPLSVVQVLTTEQIFRWTITSHAVTMMKSIQQRLCHHTPTDSAALTFKWKNNKICKSSTLAASASKPSPPRKSWT